MDGGSGLLVGKKAVAEYWSRALGRFPDLHFKLIEVYAGVGTVLIVYESVLNLRAAEWFEFDEVGRVRRALAHYAQSD